MSNDLTSMLSQWPYEPGRLVARLFMGEDQEPRIQVRLDLGLLQMHADGRPDGVRPDGFESVLDAAEAKLAAANRPPLDTPEPVEGEGEEPEPLPTTEEPTMLMPDECQALRDEAAQFYQRYLACLTLEEFDRVIRDVTHNLRILDLCATHAQDEDDRSSLEQYRPHLIAVRARALAGRLIRDGEPKAAVVILDDALTQIRRVMTDAGKSVEFDKLGEVSMLRGMREALDPRPSETQESELKRRLEEAVRVENYELAAILRDELKRLNSSEGRAKEA